MAIHETILDPILFQAKAGQAASLLKSLSNDKRLMILCRLAGNEVSVGELQKDSGLSQSAFSQHLAVLRAGKLVQTRRDGQTIYYSISDPAVLKVMETLASIYCPEILQ